MISNECIEAACEELRAVGIEPTVRHSGKHAAIVWSASGVERVFHTALTPSDYRAPLNVRSDVRRILRNDGLLVEESPASVGDRPRLFLKDGSFFTTSRDVAAHFSKAHKHVLRDIDRILEDVGPEFGRSNFGPSSYVNEQNKSQRCYNLTRDGFTLLAMGFSGADAIAWKVKYLEAFNAMESELRQSILPTSPELVGRIDRLEADLNALIDLSLSAPQPEPGYVIVKAHKRRVRNRVPETASQERTHERARTGAQQ